MIVTNRQQLLGILAIVALVLLVGDRMIFTPLVQSWKSRSEEIRDLKKNFDKGSYLLTRDRAIREHWDHMRTNALAGEFSIAEGQVLRSLDRWQQDSRIVVTSDKRNLKQNADDFSTLECHVDGSGNLSSLTRFIYEIEKDPLALKVDQIDLASQDDRGAQLTLSLQVSGLVLTPPPAP